MRLDNFYISNSDTDKLADLLKEYNKDKPLEEQRSFQTMAELILADAICQEWYRMPKGGK